MQETDSEGVDHRPAGSAVAEDPEPDQGTEDPECEEDDPQQGQERPFRASGAGEGAA